MHRTLELHYRGDDAAIPCTLSTEYAVNRGDYLEVLQHTPDAVDLSRGDLPVLVSHDNRQINVGIVENIGLVGRKLKGVLRFGSSERAKELLADVKAKIIRNLSVGYAVSQWHEDGDVMTAVRWQPHEISLVGAGADPNAALYRGIDMSDDLEVIKSTRSERKSARLATEAENDRAANILSMADSFKRLFAGDENGFGAYVEAESRKAVKSGMDAGDFSKRMMDKAPQSEPLGGSRDFEQSPYRSDIPNSEKRTYSITAAIRSMVEPNCAVGGYEREISQELAKQRNRSSGGIIVPYSAFGSGKRVVTGAGAASDLIGVQHMFGDFIDLLRNSSITLGLGATVLDGLTQNISIPRQSASATGEWLNLDGTSTITPSDPDFDSVPLTMKTVAALTVISHRAARQGLPSVDALVMRDLAQVLGTAMDVAALTGVESATVPGGILTRITPTTYTPPPALGDIVDLEGSVAQSNALMGRLAYATTPALMSTLKQTPVDAGSGMMIWSGSGEESRMNGYRATNSANVPLNNVIFGNWADVLVGMWGPGLELTEDPTYEFAKGNIAIRATLDTDVNLRHLESMEAIAPV